MAQATSLSLSQFTSAVQNAVKAAVQKHPKFKFEAPQSIVVSYLIRGIPVPEAILANATVAETQQFANDVAAGLPQGLTGAPVVAGHGALYFNGRHLIIGFPPVDPFFIEK